MKDEPNLQNIPIRTEGGAAVRRAFVNPKTWSALNIDYAEAERRFMARATEDSIPPFPTIPTTSGGFKRGEFYVLYAPNKPKFTSPDVHVLKAAELFGVPVEEVTPEMRRRAKEWTFAKRFGATRGNLDNIRILKNGCTK